MRSFECQRELRFTQQHMVRMADSKCLQVLLEEYLSLLTQLVFITLHNAINNMCYIVPCFPNN